FIAKLPPPHLLAQSSQRAFQRDAVAQHRRELLVEKGKFIVFHKPKILLNSRSSVIPWSTSDRAAVSKDWAGWIKANSRRRICSRIASSIRSHSTSGTRPPYPVRKHLSQPSPSQASHNRRASRWFTTSSTALATAEWSGHIASNRSNTPRHEPACSVEITRCPVSPARTASCA